MYLITPLDLAPNKWYFHTPSSLIFKILENNVTVIEGEGASGHLLIKPTDASPKKLSADKAARRIQNAEIKPITAGDVFSFTNSIQKPKP